MGRTVMEGKWKEAKHSFRTESDRYSPLKRGWYDPAHESQGPDTAAIQRAAKVSRQYFQFKSRYAVIGMYLQCIGKTETNRCWECTLLAPMDTHHILFNCKAWSEERRKM